jgi:hypothetical protein
MLKRAGAAIVLVATACIAPGTALLQACLKGYTCCERISATYNTSSTNSESSGNEGQVAAE